MNTMQDIQAWPPDSTLPFGTVVAEAARNSQVGLLRSKLKPDRSNVRHRGCAYTVPPTVRR